MEWITTKKRLPDRLDAYDVTLEDTYGGRLVNVAIFRSENATWEIMADKQSYQDCKVVAWKQRCEPYQGNA